MNETIDLYRNNNEMIVDAFDRIVVNLFQQRQTHNFKSFMICSCNAGVGSTAIAMELAISLAVSGWKTVLIDCDLRKENRYKRLNQKVKNGLSDYIINPMDPGEILYPTNWQGLDYIACGHREDETPVKLLCSQKMSELTAYLKQNYDFVLFDVPALNSAVDATIVGTKTDCTFLVVASEQSKFHDLETAKKQLEDAGVNIQGVILNKVPLDDYRHYMEDYNYFSDKEYLKRSQYYSQKDGKDKKKRVSLGDFFKKLMGCLVLISMLVGVGGRVSRAEQSTGTAQRSEASSVPVVAVESYSVDGSIAPGQDFKLTVRVKNMDASKEARQLLVSLHTVSGGIYLAPGETNQCYVDRLRAGGTYDCEFSLRASDSIAGEVTAIELHFQYMSDAGSGSNVATISPPVSRDCRVEIISLVTPERAVIGAKALFSLQYENSGSAELSAIRMRIQGNIVTNDEEIDLKVPEPGWQAVSENSIVFTDAGSQELTVYLSYADEEGVWYDVEPRRVVTEVVNYSGDRNVYGTDITWGEENKQLVKRETFRSIVLKVQNDYGYVILIAAVLLLLHSLLRIVYEIRRSRAAKRGKTE